MKENYVPGLVVIVLVVALVFLLILYGGGARRNRRAVAGLHELIEKSGKELDLARNVLEIDQVMGKWRSDGNPAERNVADAWEEYRETTLTPDDGNEPAIRNTVRPTTFFNLDDLGFTPGFFRIVPSLFVSVGLLLTFIGLVAALDDMGKSMHTTGDGASIDAMTGLLTIAAAKFIMSLTGLACSIVFTIRLRFGMGLVEGAVHRLCHALERRLSYVSLEDISLRQLRQTKQQVDEFRKIGTELVAELARPLREELPDRISAAIAEAMLPVVEGISKSSTSGVEGLVGDLSEKLTGSVGQALGQASDRLGQAGTQIGALVDRLNESSGRMGGGMEAAISEMAQVVGELKAQMASASQAATATMTAGADQLLGVMNETLEGIRVNTGAGAEAMREAAKEMRGAAESFRDELKAAAADGSEAARGQMQAAAGEASEAIGNAGRDMLTAFGATSAEVARLGKEMTGTVGEEIIARMEALGQQMDEMVGAVEAGASSIRTASAGLKQGSEGMATAALTFGGASRDLVAATEPVRAAHQRIEDSVRHLSESTSRTAEQVRTNAEQVAQASATTLDTARAAIGSEREGVLASLAAVQAALVQMQRQGERIDQLDEKLGVAFESFRNNVEAALDTVVSHVRQVQEILDPGLSTLRSVVEQAEAFVPQARIA